MGDPNAPSRFPRPHLSRRGYTPEGACRQRVGTTPVRIDEPLIESAHSLPDDWRQLPTPPATRKLGSHWVAETRSAGLSVPSAVVEGEFNYLLNPRHPKFARLEIGEPQRFSFDPRPSYLKRSSLRFQGVPPTAAVWSADCRRPARTVARGTTTPDAVNSRLAPPRAGASRKEQAGVP